MSRNFSPRWPALLVLALLSLAQGGCPQPDCNKRQCADLAGPKFRHNGKSFEKCVDCQGTSCETTLVGDDGKTFFMCEDSPGKTCTQASVNAQFAYCGVH